MSEWAEFHSKFASLVDESLALLAKQKLLYLLSHLKGEAYDKVASLLVTDDSYAIAITMLRNSYHNPCLAMQKYYSAMFRLAPMNITSAESIRKLVDQFLGVKSPER